MSPSEERHQHLSVKSSFLTNKAAAFGLWFELFLMMSMDAELSCSISCYSEDDDEDGVP